MRPVASSAPAIACTVASQPLAAAWSRMSLSSALRSGPPRESMCSRSPPGSALLTLLFAHAPGRRHRSASWLAGSVVSVGASPYARGCSATTAPSRVATVTVVAPIPHTSSLPASDGSEE